jgi:hypothetical protein
LKIKDGNRCSVSKSEPSTPPYENFCMLFAVFSD